MNHKVIIILVSLLFIMTACSAKKDIIIKKLPDAENMAFSDDGRLFVTGGKSIYEVVRKSDGSYDKVSLYEGDAQFLGVVVSHGYIYANTMRGGLFGKKKNYIMGGRLDTKPVLKELYYLEDSSLLNGMAVDSAGRLYLCAMEGCIYQVIFSESNPLEVTAVGKLVDKNLEAANGIKIKDNEIYITDNNFTTLHCNLRKITIDKSGNFIEMKTLVHKFGIFDDLVLYNEGILVTNFSGGALSYYDYNGKLLMEGGCADLSCPSSVVPVIGNLFPSGNGKLLVTEKGMLMEMNSPFGNKLVLLAPEDGGIAPVRNNK